MVPPGWPVVLTVDSYTWLGLKLTELMYLHGAIEMSILSKVTEFVGGSLFKEIKEGVMSYFPPDLSPQQRAEIELKIDKLAAEKQAAANKMLTEAAAQLDKRIAEQEGTAKDLLAMPILGRVVLFLRGLQRPVWGFATLLMDWKWFFGSDTFTEQQQTAMIVINILVLGFLFGERTLKNLEPLIVKVFGGK